MQYLKAPKAKLSRNIYNMAGISFTPEELAASIKKYDNSFSILQDHAGLYDRL
jgi:hypothetical protein